MEIRWKVRFLNRTIHHAIVDRTILNNPLIVWNKLFEVDDAFTEK